MNDTIWLTVSEASEKSGIPIDTLRRYIRVHGVHLKVKKVHKKYQISNESMNVLQEIRELYANGKNVDEVEQALSESGVTMTITVESSDNERMTVNVADELQEIRQFLDEQRHFNKLLVERLETQQAYIDNRMNERDERLMQAIRELQEQKRITNQPVAYKEELNIQFEKVNEELKYIQQQQSEFKDNQHSDNQLKELTGQIELLTKQLQEMKDAIAQTATSDEHKKKQGLFSRLFRKR